jgi:hypothetical protein
MLTKLVLLFVFWYCHKRGKETRLLREKTVDSDGRIIELEDDPMLDAGPSRRRTEQEGRSDRREQRDDRDDRGVRRERSHRSDRREHDNREDRGVQRERSHRSDRSEHDDRDDRRERVSRDDRREHYHSSNRDDYLHASDNTTPSRSQTGRRSPGRSSDRSRSSEYETAGRRRDDDHYD